MTAFAIRGWCPDAWRPMASGDGLLVRVRPPLGRLDRAQALGLAEAALAHGNGQIDATRRGNLQVRGVGEAGWPALVARLVALGLVAADPARDARPAVLAAPDWMPGDDSARIAAAFAARLDALPALPAKIGFVVDAGPAPMLGDVPGDFRIERGGDGRLLLRAAGRESGVAVSAGREAAALIALARWFVTSGGAAAGRMARHAAPLPRWALGDRRPAPARARIVPGAHPLGTAYGLPFGRIDARALIGLIAAGQAAGLRITPWRIVIVEGDGPRAAEGFLIDPAAPALRVDACPGAPACPQASVETRPLAHRLAPFVAGRLHVSGCAKGCARGRAADVVLTGGDGLFDLARDARAGDPPARTGLSAAQVLALLGAA